MFAGSWTKNQVFIGSLNTVIPFINSKHNQSHGSEWRRSTGHNDESWEFFIPIFLSGEFRPGVSEIFSFIVGLVK